MPLLLILFQILSASNSAGILVLCGHLVRQVLVEREVLIFQLMFTLISSSAYVHMIYLEVTCIGMPAVKLLVGIIPREE